MLSVTLRQLEYVVAVARHGGVSAAAAALNVSQPALSVAVAQLEARLGKPLFIRRKGGPVAPTGHGRAFVEEAARLLAGVERLVDPAATLDELGRPVVIGCFEDLAPLLLAPLLARLRARRPQTPVTPRVGGFELLAEELRAGRVDFALTYDLGLDESFEKRPIATLHPHAVMAENHPLAGRASAGRPSISLAELAGEPLILADQGLSVRHMLGLFRERGLTPRIAHRAASLETLRSLAGNGLGVGLTYTLPKARHSYDGRPLATLPLADATAGEPVIVATSTLNTPTAPVTALIAETAALRDLLEG